VGSFTGCPVFCSEDFLKGFSNAANDFASAFGRSDTHVFAGCRRASAEVAGCVDGMQGGEIGGAFSRSLRRIACAFGSAFSNVAGAIADVLGRTAALFPLIDPLIAARPILIRALLRYCKGRQKYSTAKNQTKPGHSASS
jgi:hypothetical protein